jgi:glycosyltransferase involved in cell wall biosynthesis
MVNNIKVLHTEWSDGWGGQEIRIINEMIAVREKGIEVFLACRDNSIIKEKALENNIKVFLVPFRGNLDFKTIFSLVKIIKEEKINIVNTHSGKDTWVGGIAAKLSCIKFIRTRHLSNRINASRFNFINELADYIITTGESVKNDMIKYNRINPKKIISIPTGIDEQLFDPLKYEKVKSREFFGLENDYIIVAIVAVLRSFKRHDRFIKIAKRILDKYPNKKIKFLIAGDGPRKDKIFTQIEDENLKEKILMLGHISDVAKLLSSIDIFLLTSDSKEGVPQSVMQAMLMNKAVISTNVGSTSDLLNNNNFLLIDKDDENEMFTTCDKLIVNDELRSYYSNNSRIFISENFSKSIMTEKIIKIYKELI